MSGCDIVLRGAFDTVRLTACTVDPGTAGPGAPPLATAADGAPAGAEPIFVEADPAAPAGAGRRDPASCWWTTASLGPIRTRFGGSVER